MAAHRQANPGPQAREGQEKKTLRLRAEKDKKRKTAFFVKPLEELVKDLPPDSQQEVRDYIERLVEKRERPRQNRMRLTWAGALKEYRDQYTSLDLQKKALEWWGD